MSGSASWQQKNVPVRFTSMTRSQACGVRSTDGAKPTMPALVTRTCTGPSSERTLAKASSTAARSVTSAADRERGHPLRAKVIGDPLRRSLVEVETATL